MRLHKRTATVISGLTAVALIGLIAIQVYLLANAMELRRNAFRQNVHAALSEIVQKLETRDVAKRFFNVKVNVDEKTIVEGMPGAKIAPDSLPMLHGLWVHNAGEPTIPEINLDSSKVTFMLRRPQYVRLRLLDSLGRAVENLVDGQQPAGRHEIYFVKSNTPRDNLHFNFVTDSTSLTFQVEKSSGATPKRKFTAVRGQQVLADRIMRELSDLKREPLDRRVNLTQLDSLVQQILQAKEISARYAYGILIAAEPDSVTFVNQPQYKKQLLRSEFKSALFPNDIFAEENQLAIFFPQQNVYLLQKIGVSIVTSLVFISVLILCFIYIVRTLFR
ncbi:MAG TPA: hypothetical protein VGA99_07055, partial [bacterium]